MMRFLTYAVIVIGMGATAMFSGSYNKVSANTSGEMRLAADGAYRDGLYLGKLAADGGQSSRPAIGRWSSVQDRSMFAAGYRRGFGEGR
jgi:hypothetical protein